MTVDKRIYVDKMNIEEMRMFVKWCDWQREGFLERFTLPQLVKLFNACQLCGWDFFPDQWTDRQVRAALLRDEVPDWHDDERPKGKGVTPEEALKRRTKEAEELALMRQRLGVA